MEYVFGTELDGGVKIETVKTVSETPATMFGNYTVKRAYADSVITDTFNVVRQVRAKESEGLHYAWYEITDHYRYEDRFTPGIVATEQEITEQELALIEAEQTITDLDLRVMELEIANE